MNENSGNVFSSWFEKLLISLLEKYFETFLKLAEERASKPKFIKQKNISDYYDGCSVDTLAKYEEKGLKRCEPIEGGNVFYSTEELDRFMLKYQAK